MNYKPVWTEERENWLWQHRTEGRQELYDLFCEAFPEVHTTINGVCGHRSVIGASIPRKGGGIPRKPLYAEQVKKGYVKIKIGQPSTWEYKQKWVWMETHPWLYNEVKPTDVFIFLDGDNRNFNPDNIYKLTRAELGIVNNNGGIEKGNPELTMFRIAQAKLKIATLDAGEKVGDVVHYGRSRAFRSDINRHAKEYREKNKDNPHYRELIKAQHKRALENATPEQRAKRLEYQRNWIKRKRENDNKRN